MTERATHAERQAADDANEASRTTTTETAAKTAGVLDTRSDRPLPGDADEAVGEHGSDT